MSNDLQALTTLLFNSYLSSRQQLINAADPARARTLNIDAECKYPLELKLSDYIYMYDRNGIAQRVVSVFPEECWCDDPDVFETMDSDETNFESMLSTLNQDFQIWSMLEELDIQSGIGSFGVMLIGLADGQTSLEQPVNGYDETTGMIKGGTPNPTTELLYLRVFREDKVTPSEININPYHPRYGKPEYFNIQMESNTIKVHWTRVLDASEGEVSRLHSVFNDLLDLKKVGGGSAEMFWRGAFPGISFEVNPDFIAAGATLDADTMREEFTKYSEGLQRYLALTGVTAKSLAPQVVDPMPHLTAILRRISIAKRIPQRIFEGSEAAQLASSQDSKAFNKRLNRRRTNYITPKLIRPFIDRLILVGVLPMVEEYFVEWSDLNASTEKEEVENAKSITETLSKYVQGGVEGLIDPEHFMTEILKWDVDLVASIMEEVQKRAAEMLDDQQSDLDPNNDVTVTTTTTTPRP